jgi:hypothetical protein
LAYKITGKSINLTEEVFSSSNAKTVGRNTLDKLADHSAGGKMNILSFKNQNSNLAFAKHLYDTGHLFDPMECIMDTLHFVK